MTGPAAGAGIPALQATPAALVGAIKGSQPDESANVGWGVVTAVTPPTVSLRIRGQAAQITGVACLASYSPLVGDTVAIIEWPTSVGEDRLVLGATVAPTVPAGSIIMHGGAAPAGWLTCDGSAVSKTVNPGLFAAIGYTYGGSGDSFNLPDLASAFPMGNTPGGSGGAASHTHLGPSHTHTGPSHTHSTPSHQHALDGQGWAYVTVNGSSGGVVAATEGVGSWTDDGFVTGTASGSGGSHSDAAILGGATDTTGTGTTGAGGTGATGADGDEATSSGSNLPPYTGVRFIIKT